MQCLSVVPSRSSPFTNLFVPMVVTQIVMRKALLCPSASHLRRKHHSFEKEMVQYRDESFAAAVQLVRSHHPHPHLHHDHHNHSHGHDPSYHERLTERLAAILLLCIQEVCEGRSVRWPQHLAAAVNIIHLRGEPSAFPPELSFLIEATAYFDLIATLSFSRAPLLDPVCYLPQEEKSTSTKAGAKGLREHALFGTAHELIVNIATGCFVGGPF